jgi:hypothetical protein
VCYDPAFGLPLARFTLDHAALYDGASGLERATISILREPQMELVREYNFSLDQSTSFSFRLDEQAWESSTYAVLVNVTDIAGLSTCTPTGFMRFTEDYLTARNGSMHVCNAAGAAIDAVAILDGETSAEIHLCFSDFVIPPRGITHHEVTLTGFGMGFPWQTTVPHAPLTSFTKSGIRMMCGRKYTVSSVAKTGLASPLNSGPTLTSSVTIECTPPDVSSAWVKVTDADPELTKAGYGACVPADHPTALRVAWAGFDEPQTRIKQYNVTVSAGGSRANGGVPVFTKSLGMRSNTFIPRQLFESAPANYTIEVGACNSVGLCTSPQEVDLPAVSFLMVDGPPLAGSVSWVDSDGGEVLYTTSAPGQKTSLRGAFFGFDDITLPERSLQYDICVGTSPYGCEKVGWMQRYNKKPPAEVQAWVDVDELPPTPVCENTCSYAMECGEPGCTDTNGNLRFCDDSLGLCEYGTDCHDCGVRQAVRPLPLQCGSTVYLTVRATNCAGMHNASASRGLKVCCEGPEGGHVTVLPTSPSVINDTNVVQWGGFEEPCSGVSHYDVEVFDSSGALIANQTDVPPSQSMWRVPLVLGGDEAEQYTATVTATSGAKLRRGASFTFSNEPMRPPPKDLVTISWERDVDGEPSLSPIRCLPAAVKSVSVSWLGMRDNASAVRNFALGHHDDSSGNAPGAWTLDDGTSWSWEDMGAALTVQLPASGVPGTSTRYYAVRACNRVGLCTTSHVSSGVRRLKERPSGGSVRLHRSPNVEGGFLHGTSAPLVGSWGGFASGSPISSMDVHGCLGTTRHGCQLLPFVELAQEGTATFINGTEAAFTNASMALTCGSSYHLTVRATNCAGHKHTVASGSVKVCCHAPVGVVSLQVRDGPAAGPVSEDLERPTFISTSTTDVIDIHYSVSEPCSGLREIYIELRTGSGKNYSLTGINASASDQLQLSAPVLKTLGVLEDGVPFHVAVWSSSRAGFDGWLRTPSSILIDDTPPVLSEPPDLYWPRHVDVNGSLSETWCLPWPAVEPSVRVSWHGAHDDESGIAGFEIWVHALESNTTSRIDANVSRSLWLPVEEETLVFKVRACNRVGLCAESGWSRGVRRVSSAPSGGEVYLGDGTNTEVPLINSPSAGLVGSWGSFDAGVPDSEIALEACVGTSEHGCQLAPFARVAASSTSLPLSAIGVGAPLVCGRTYHLTVRATNCAGLHHSVHSNGVRLCCAVPTGRVALLVGGHELQPSSVGHHVTNHTDVKLRISGLREPCSGVAELTAAVETANGNMTIAQLGGEELGPILSGGSVDVAISLVELVEHGLLAHGGEMRVAIWVRSHAELTGYAQSAETVILDLIPPVAAVAIGLANETTPSCLSTVNPVVCSWDVSDGLSGVGSVEWAVSASSGASGLNFTHARTLPTSLAGSVSSPVLHGAAATREIAARMVGPGEDHVYCHVRVTDRVGLTTTASSETFARLIDPSSCDDDFVCVD